MIHTTLCYIERNGAYLLLHRIKKKQDPNEGKWIGIGGKLEPGETVEECLLREVHEETGLTLTKYRYAGKIRFESDTWPTEIMHLYHAEGFTGDLLPNCPEGRLAWVAKAEAGHRPMWEGDRIFLDLMEKTTDFFSLLLRYRGDTLVESRLLDNADEP